MLFLRYLNHNWTSLENTLFAKKNRCIKPRVQSGTTPTPYIAYDFRNAQLFIELFIILLY